MTARDRIVIAIVAVVALMAGSWILVIQPKRDQASKLGAQISTAQSTLDAARSQVLTGLAAKRSFGRDYTSIAQLGEAVPSDDNVPSLIFQLQSAATGAGVDFRVLKLTPSAGGSAAPAPAAGIGTSAAQSTTATLPPGAAVGPAGFPILPFTFTFRGNFFHLSDFFSRLEKFVVATNQRVAVSGRLMSLNAISLGADPNLGFPHIVATIAATTYLVPATQGVLNGATPAGPGTGTATQASAGGGGSTPAAPAAIAAPTQ
jgi:type II secretory pathway pseudopilin PulG